MTTRNLLIAVFGAAAIVAVVAGATLIAPRLLAQTSAVAPSFEVASALVIARADGKLGPRLHESSTDCQALMAARRGGPPPVAPAPGDRPPCGLRGGPGSLTAGGFPLSQLAATVSQRLQRAVIDRTGLTGNFDFDLTWTPDQIPRELQGPDAPPSPPVDPNGPSIFTALQEQLGLKLDSQKGPVEVFVIDRVEPPTED